MSILIFAGCIAVSLVFTVSFLYCTYLLTVKCVNAIRNCRNPRIREPDQLWDSANPIASTSSRYRVGAEAQYFMANPHLPDGYSVRHFKINKQESDSPPSDDDEGKESPALLETPSIV